MKMPLDLDYMTGLQTGGDRPAAVGQKFSDTGQVLPFGGNTFICHIDATGPAHRALVIAQDMLRAGAPSGAYTYLPPASLHMTVFEGVCDAHRDFDRWPRGMDPASPVGEVTRDFLNKFRMLRRSDGFRIAPIQLFAGLSVLVDGASPGDLVALRSVRGQLQEMTGIHKPGFATYQFHITLSYLLRWLTPDEALMMQNLSSQAFALLADQAPVIPLGPPEFCRFDDMHFFHPVVI